MSTLFVQTLKIIRVIANISVNFCSFWFISDADEACKLDTVFDKQGGPSYYHSEILDNKDDCPRLCLADRLCDIASKNELPESSKVKCNLYKKSDYHSIDSASGQEWRKTCKPGTIKMSCLMTKPTK